MKKYKVKLDSKKTNEFLLMHGFKKTENGIYFRESVVIDLSGEVSWRFGSMEGKSLEKEILDIMEILDVEGATYTELSIDKWVNKIHENAVAHGWWEDDRELPEIIALVHSELSEALEEYRDGKPMLYFIEDKPEGIAVEMIDAVIRVFDYLGKLDIDVEEILSIKHAYNEKRPYKHGGKKI